VSGFFYGPAFFASIAGGGSGPSAPQLAGYRSVVLAAGANNDVNPGGTWPNKIARVDFDTSAGDANLNSLVAASDGIMVLLRNTGANNLNIINASGLGAAANQFKCITQTITQFDTVLATYYAQGINRWVLR
jgi:hypothetical protein